MFYRKNLPANTAPAIIIYPIPLFFFFLPTNIYLNVNKFFSDFFQVFIATNHALFI